MLNHHTRHELSAPTRDVLRRLITVTKLCCACTALLAACTGGSAGPANRSAADSRSSAGSPGSAFQNGTNLLVPVSKDVQTADGAGANGCVAGHYVGSFKGTYNSAAWGNGSVPLSIEAVPSMCRPGLEFWLEKSDNACGSAEFCADFTVKGGKIRGFANPFSDPNADPSKADASSPLTIAVRFEIDFGGELDCSRGQFKGLLQNGCYDVATVLFRFEGTAPATYDHASSSFTDGKWMVKELAMPNAILTPDPSIGGMGTWDAALVKDNAAPMKAGTGLCHM